MSQQALRYRKVNILTFEEARALGSLKKITRHHVPPQRPDRLPRIIKIDERHHRAYHLIFGNAASFEDCVAILKRDWWT